MISNILELPSDILIEIFKKVGYTHYILLLLSYNTEIRDIIEEEEKLIKKGISLEFIVSDIKSIIWAYELPSYNIPLNVNLFKIASRVGNLSVITYLNENNCPWDRDTCWGAARNGNLDCLKYAHDNGCPWDEDTCTNAKNNILDWLDTVDCPCGKTYHERN